MYTKDFILLIRSDLQSFYFCDPDERSDALVNGKAVKNVPVPQKSLPDLPPPRPVSYYQICPSKTGKILPLIGNAC